MISTEFNLHGKYILLAIEEVTTFPLKIIDFLIEQNALITIMSSQSLPVKVESLRRKGFLGCLNQAPSADDVAKYHLTILPSLDNSNSRKIWSECQIQRRFCTVLDDSTKSDIPFHLGSEACFSDDQTLYDTTSDSDTETGISFYKSIQNDPKPKGTLYLVGVGPGSPDLLTLAASRIIHKCPVIISDRLVDISIYNTIPKTTRVLFSRKICGKAREAQNQINDWIIEYLSQGIDVVRVKGGDPFVFGRGGEEWNLALKNSFAAEWIPGISSCIAAPGAAGIPVTHRGVADSFVVSTGQKEDGTWSGISDYSPTRTLVLLMATGVLSRLKAQLEKYNYPKETPAAVIYRATYPDQQVVIGTIDNIAVKVSERKISNHATIVVGNVVHCLINKSI